jgi:hypothetical protein
MSLATVESEITSWWHELTGEARAEIQKALDDAKAEEADVAAQLKTLIAAAKAAVEEAVTAAEPGIAAAVKTLVGQLEADVLKVLAAEV